MQGTSMACPHVSGVAALVLSRLGSETYTPELLRERLLLSARPIPTEPLYAAKKMGIGLIDASRAVLDYEAVTGVHLDPSVDTVYANRTIKLNAAVEPPTATNNHVTWQTADPDIATVDEMGVVTGKAAGTVTISVLTVQGSFTASAAITVIPVLAEGISVAFQQATIKKGESLVLIADITPADATNKAVEWYSKNTSNATIKNTGVVVGINVGDTYIVAVSDDGGFKDSCLVSVVQTVQDVELITPQTVRLALGDTTTIKARVLPPDAYDQQIYFMSGNSGIVSVDANTGKIQAKKTGIATITVRTNDGNFITTCEVTVYDGAHAPEGFSPNNDGHNDYFEFILDSRESYTLHVFDRSGQVHYKSDDYKNDWDGTANTGPQSGKKVRAGTYYYRLAGKLLGKVKTGYVVVKY
jgi:gliding motility-associated-like protein